MIHALWAPGKFEDSLFIFIYDYINSEFFLNLTEI